MSSSSHSTMQASGAARSITVRDVVSWKQEEAFRMGEIGFDTAFPDMNEIAQNFSYGDIDKNGWPAPAEDDSFLVAAAVELHDNVRSLQHHQHLMRQNPTIVTAAMKAVDQQLIALRRASKEKQRRSLREKVAELYELKHLKKKPNCVTVWVNPRPTTGLNQMMEINLPFKSTIAGINDIFHQVTQSELSYLKSTVRPNMNVDEEGGLWKYQLLSRDLTTVINKTSVLLKSDNDYSKMIKMVTMGAQAPLAVLTQEKLAKPAGPNEHHVQNGGHEAGEQCTTKADRKENVASTAAQEDEGPVWDDNKVINEPLDMDGNPYFEPPTLKGNKRAYEKIGEKLKRYGWDDWPVKDEEEEKMLIDRMVARDLGYEYHG